MEDLEEKQIGRNQTFQSTLQEVRFSTGGEGGTKDAHPLFITSPARFLSEPNFLSRRMLMNISTNLTFKQQRFVEEYQVDGNGTQAVLRAGYQTKKPAEMASGLLRNTKFKHRLQSAQNARRERLQMRVDSKVKQYIELKDRALEACDYQTSLRALNRLAKHLRIFEHYPAAPLLPAIKNNPDDF